MVGLSTKPGVYLILVFVVVYYSKDLYTRIISYQIAIESYIFYTISSGAMLLLTHFT